MGCTNSKPESATKSSITTSTSQVPNNDKIATTKDTSSSPQQDKTANQQLQSVNDTITAKETISNNNKQAADEAIKQEQSKVTEKIQENVVTNTEPTVETKTVQVKEEAAAKSIATVETLKETQASTTPTVNSHTAIVTEEVVAEKTAEAVAAVESNTVVVKEEVVAEKTAEAVAAVESNTVVVKEEAVADKTGEAVEAVETAQKSQEVTAATAESTTVAEDVAEKSLEVAPSAASAVSKPLPPSIKKGLIAKQGHFVKNWKNRYFVLEDGKFSYYETSSPNPPYGINLKGDFSLKGVELTVNKSILRLAGEDGGNAKGHRELILEIKYPNERDEWISAIQSHIQYCQSN